jgi:Tfp pilus assembly protein PilV
LKYKRSAFTIIEVMVSVLLISIVILAIIKMQQQTKDMALYLSDRGKHELSNTLFLDKSISKYDKTTKDAYSVLDSQNFHINDDDTKKILKNISRKINISDDMNMGDEELIHTKLNTIMLKAQYSARFIHFEL